MFGELFKSKPKPKKILFIEDEATIIKYYKDYFSSKTGEYEAYYAMSKEEILAHFDKVDMVISDYHLEGMQFSFKQIRSMCADKKPLLLISGDIKPMYKYQLSKPVPISAIKKQIDKMLAENLICPPVAEKKPLVRAS